jgi:HPt (histidine-containing phosphotransfer) domain-containing protein
MDLPAFRATMRDAGAEDAVEGILSTFLATAQQRHAELGAALAEGDARLIERAAHAFRSAAGAVAARTLADHLHTMEDAAKRDDVAGARELGNTMHREVNAVLSYLQAQGVGLP